MANRSGTYQTVIFLLFFVAQIVYYKFDNYSRRLWILKQLKMMNIVNIVRLLHLKFFQVPMKLIIHMGMVIYLNSYSLSAIAQHNIRFRRRTK